MAVKDTASEELRKLTLLEVGSFRNEKIPFLEEVLDHLPPDKKLMLDIKVGQEILSSLITILINSGKASQVWLISYSWTMPSTITTEVPGVHLMRHGGGDASQAQIDLIIMNENGMEAVVIGRNVVNSGYVEVMRAGGKDVYVYTVNDLNSANDLAAMGVNNIITDKVKIIKQGSY